MPINLDSCIAGVFTPGNIGASSGLPPVEPTVPSLDGAAPAVWETVAATDTLDFFMGELLHEIAHASDSYLSTGGAYVVVVAESAVAVDAVSLPSALIGTMAEMATATDAPSASVGAPGVVVAAVTETAAAADAPDATVITALVARSAMLPEVFVNSDGTARDANANGVMVNL